MIKSNYHTHALYCNHAEGYVKDYVKKAVDLNFFEIGITDHAPILESFMSKDEYENNWCYQNMKLETLPIYFKDIDEAKILYGDKISILTGFETEYLEEQIDFYRNLRSMVDYLNLGIHYFRYNGKVYNSYSEVNYKTLDGYVNACINGMESGLFNTLVHPDLFMFDYKNINGERKFDEYAIEASKKIIASAIKNNIYLEVNANGLKNSKIWGNGDWLYPYKDFWLIARNYTELKILIGADAHSPDALANQNVKDVCDFCDELGLKICEKMVINH